jgi:hypothetical protein
MRSTITGLAFLLLTSTTYAATTAEEAAKVQANMEAYFGKGMLKIEPNGDAFKAKFDASKSLETAKAIDAMKAQDITVSMPKFEFDLAPLGNGKWKITHSGTMNFSGAVKDQIKIEEVFGSNNMVLEYDEALGNFSNYSAEAKDITLNEDISETSGGPAKLNGKIDSMSFKGTSVANPAGGIDIKVDENIGPLNFVESVSPTGEAPVSVNIKADGGSFSMSATGTKSLELLGLWRFLVANPSQDAIVKAQTDYKALLVAALPLFANMQGAGAMNKLQIGSPVGNIELGKATFGMSVNGVQKDGKFQESFGFEGLGLPEAIVPPFAKSLVPNAANVDFAISGYDAETPAKAALAIMDLSKPDIVPKEMADQLMKMLLPTGEATLTLSKTFVSNDLYNIAVEGNLTGGPGGLPKGKAHITAKGLDAIMKAIQDAPPEAGLQQGSAVIIVAKGLGKAESDGSLSWDVESAGDGKVTVNGTDISKLK